jgi:hypothetical protein
VARGPGPRDGGRARPSGSSGAPSAATRRGKGRGVGVVALVGRGRAGYGSPARYSHDVSRSRKIRLASSA